ncbi:MAG: hypothetical protein K2G93_06145 [Rikenella sp.]|nr:hypothetical protein [Rikenella sp.]
MSRKTSVFLLNPAGARSENVVGENIPRATAGVGNRSKAIHAFEQDFRQRAGKECFLERY